MILKCKLILSMSRVREVMEMFNPTISERLLHQIDVKTRKMFVKTRQRQLNETNFTIIANNCWGG